MGNGTKCDYCGKYYYEGGVSSTFRWDIGGNQYRYKQFDFCCDGHYHLYKNITDKKECDSDGVFPHERNAVNERKRKEDFDRNAVTCSKCGTRNRKSSSYAYFRNGNNTQSCKIYYFCDSDCYSEFVSKGLVRCNSNGLTDAEQKDHDDKENSIVYQFQKGVQEIKDSFSDAKKDFKKSWQEMKEEMKDAFKWK